jgi:hypothetical protein
MSLQPEQGGGLLEVPEGGVRLTLPPPFSQSSGGGGDISVGASSPSLSPGSLRAVGPDLETNPSPF